MILDDIHTTEANDHIVLKPLNLSRVCTTSDEYEYEEEEEEEQEEPPQMEIEVYKKVTNGNNHNYNVVAASSVATKSDSKSSDNWEFVSVVNASDGASHRLNQLRNKLSPGIYEDIATLWMEQVEFLERHPKTTDLSLLLMKPSGALYNRQFEEYMNASFWRIVRDRSPWLILTMLLLSLISITQEYLNEIVGDHFVILTYVVCLVGAVGNSSLQPSVWIKTAYMNHYPKIGLLFRREMWASLVISILLAVALFIRIIVEFPEERVAAFCLGITLIPSNIVAVLFSVGITILLNKIPWFNAGEGALSLITVIVDVLSSGILCVVVLMFRPWLEK
jgi:hypothetical protein